MNELKDAKVVLPLECRKLVLVNLNTPALGEFRSYLSENHALIDVASDDETIRIVDKMHDNIAAVLFDVKKARENGFALLKKMNDDKRFVGIPCLAVSETVNPDNCRESLLAGASEYFEPPFRQDLLERRLMNAVRSKDSATFSEVEKILRALPSNIYLKDAEGKYIFATHYWHHVRTDESDPDWTIRGKTDVEVRENKENAQKALDSDMEIVRTGVGTNYIVEEQGENGTEYLELIKRPVFDDTGKVTGIIAIVNNITELQTLKLEFEKRSKTDQLTGLFNKQATEELISQVIEEMESTNGTGALLMIDVDKFKHVNDTYGHIVGDRVLMAMGDIIFSSFKGMDIMGRIGGDEFMVFLRDVDSEAALLLADSISEKARELFPDEPVGKCISLSIGVSLYPEHGREFEELYRSADKALYHVKENGRNSYRLYSPQDDAKNG